MTEWGDAIERLLKARGWKQKQLAEAAKITENQVSAMVGGDTNPQIETLRRVADAFEVPLYELFVPAELAGNIRAVVDSLGSHGSTTTQLIQGPNGSTLRITPEVRQLAALFSRATLREEIEAAVRTVFASLAPSTTGHTAIPSAEQLSQIERNRAEAKAELHRQVPAARPHRSKRVRSS